MSKRLPGKEQPKLFLVEGSHEKPSYLSWQEIEKTPAEQVRAVQSEHVGAHVNVTERAERLVQVMNALAHRNMLQGFDVGVNDHRYSPPIFERYLNATPRVAEAARTKVDRLQKEAEDDFWHAMGFEALRGTGLLTHGEVRSRSDKMWRDFHDRFGSPRNHKELNNFRKKQKRLLPEDHVLRQKKVRKGAEGRELAA